MWVAIIIFVFIFCLLAYLDSRKPKNFPPGPRWWPIVGSAPQVVEARRRTGSLYDATAEMSRIYGPVLGLKVGKDLLIVVYGPQAVREFLTSDDLSGRPNGWFYEVRTWGKRRGVLLTDEGLWQEQRRFLLRQLREFGFGRRNMSTLIEEELAHFEVYIKDCMKGKSSVIFNVETLFNVSILNTLWKMTAGVRYSPEDKKMKELQGIIAKMFSTVHMIGAAFSHFPILKYIAPDLSGYNIYLDAHKHIWEFLYKELEYHKETHNPHEPRDLMDVYLNVLNSPDRDDTFSEEQLVAVCLDMFLAGSETTSNTLTFCIQHLILYPDVQKKAQEEIDRVLGDRTPTLEDRPKMPYMECIVLEALRMFSGRAFTVPHRALRDTYLNGHFIPKDVLVAANLHGCFMGRDSGFKDPEVFIPERYLKDGKIYLPDNYIPFGLGRHRCMGETLARANVFLFTCSLLQKFNLSVVPDYPPDMKIIDGVTPGPKHFKARVSLR